ncbi:MAG TPA: hypothetical protein PK185_03455 [Cyclobacteriaceae bacterium]|nr:hypothetical protein [Cyclobacteriaceae bacterium]
MNKVFHALGLALLMGCVGKEKKGTNLYHRIKCLHWGENAIK